MLTAGKLRTMLGASALALATFTLIATPAGAAPTTSTGTDGVVTSSVTLDNTTPAPGDTVTFTFHTATPDGLGYLADELVASAELAPNLQLTDCGPTTCSVDQFAVYAFPAPGDSTVAVHVKVDPAAPIGTSYVLTPTIAYYDQAGHQLLLTPTIPLTVTTPPSADLSVQLAARSGLLSNKVAYTATITDHGPGGATSATVTTALPVGAAGFSSTDGCTLAGGGHAVSCPVGTLAAGHSVTRKFSVTYPLLTVGLPLKATATRTASAPTDPNAANDSGSASCTAVTALIILC